MGLRELVRRKGTAEPVLEAKAPASVGLPVLPAPRGFDAGVPKGGTTLHNTGGTGGSMSRQDYLAGLYGAYVACPWSSAAVDAVARTCTAGGLMIQPDDQTDTAIADQAAPDGVQRLRRLVDYVNPTDDIRQLLTGSLQDLQVFGDAFLEVVWLLGEPVALYPLDSPSMVPLADEHGVISGYTQHLDATRTVSFEPHEVIHISMGGLRDSVYGVGPTHKAELPIRTWLFTKALLKEQMRKGLPPSLHVDFPLDVQPSDTERFRQQYQARNLGIENIGNPILSRGNAAVKELQASKVAELLATLNLCRDEILSVYGTPPAKVGVIESGNLGGGTGTSQDRTFKVNTCGPLTERLLEKLTFALLISAYGVTGWRFRAGQVDWRDDQVVETIRDLRLRNGSWSLNDYLADIDRPRIGPDGDVRIMTDRTHIVPWQQIQNYADAEIASMNPAQVAGADEQVMGLGPSSGESRGPRSPEQEAVALAESWRRAYQQRRKQALRQLPPAGDVA